MLQAAFVILSNTHLKSTVFQHLSCMVPWIVNLIPKLISKWRVVITLVLECYESDCTQ
jgi:hypothetical protein